MNQEQAVKITNATDDAALSGLRKQIFANAMYLFPKIVQDYREQQITSNPPKASDIFDIVTFTGHSAVHGVGIAARLMYGGTDGVSAKTAVQTHASKSRATAMRALLRMIEGLFQANKDLLGVHQCDQGVPSEGEGLGMVDSKLCISNVQYAKDLRSASSNQERG